LTQSCVDTYALREMVKNELVASQQKDQIYK